MKKYFLLFAVILFINACKTSSTDDEAAIKKVLEKESATWRAGDIKGHAECWHVQPYSRILVSTNDGQTFDVPPASIVNPSPDMMDNGGSSVNTNYKMSIHDNTAWVSHDETSTDKEGKKNYSYEIRLLEKINGEWKLVGQSIHLYNKK
jgi:hypothetical protein